jgi:chemotaxis protein methyltransferase CheR
MNRNDFDLICKLLKQESGLILSPDKAYLLESRLLPVARKWKLATFDDLAKTLRGNTDAALLRDVVEAMTTNESFFFRDARPFEQFKEIVLPAMVKNRGSQKRIRIWSAACSSGQEPYSLGMILSDLAGQLAGWQIEIVATDLSGEMLVRGREGIYSQFEVQRGLPINLLVKYFKQVGDRWQIGDKLRAMVNFREFNLLTDPAPLGRFDVVFCRNVLIYFDQETKAKVLDGIARQMPNDGFLFLGGAETVLGLTDRFQLLPGQRGIYGLTQKQAAVAAAG